MIISPALLGLALCLLNAAGAKLFCLNPLRPLPLRLRWRLAKNKMALAGHGAQTIPFILSSTVISASRPPWENILSPSDPTQPTEASGCGVINQDLPCE